MPILLLVGCDGTRGDESLVALGGFFLLAILLSVFEVRPWRVAVVAAASGLTTVIVSSAELLAFDAMKVFRGPLGYYGLLNTMAVLAGLLMAAGGLAAWADTRAVIKQLS
ncbi:MAG TPA: hypothetical protein VEC99_16020 [Clostridia bacterium]|nr:hypothetical protein [Clostridia bacterium]